MWKSAQDYIDAVHPIAVKFDVHSKLPNTYYPLLARIERAFSYLENIEQCILKVENIKSADEYYIEHHDLIDQLFISLCDSIENAMLLFQPISRGKISENAIIEKDNWTHLRKCYSSESTLKYERVVTETLVAAREYIKNSREIVRESLFSEADFRNLDENLKLKFRQANDLYSVDQIECASMTCLQALEYCIRKIVSSSTISIPRQAGKRVQLLSELPLHEIINHLSQLKWKDSGVKIISKTTSQFLLFIKENRNSIAHSGTVDEIVDDDEQYKDIMRQSLRYTSVLFRDSAGFTREIAPFES